MTTKSSKPPIARSRVAWNTGIGSASQILILGTAFLTTPVLLHALGEVKFGAYAVIASLTMYFGILDLGIGGSLTRYMTFYSERRQSTEVRAITTFGFIFYLTFAIVLLPMVIMTSESITNFLGLDTKTVSHPDLLIVYVFGLFIFSSFGGIISARLASIHRLDVVSINNVLAVIAYAISVIVLTPRYPAVETVLACIAIQQTISISLNLFAVFRLCGFNILVNPIKISVHRIRELFGFGIWSQLNSICSVLNMEADKVIISSQLGVSQVAPYHVANRLALLSRALPLQMLGSLLPDVTARISRNDSQQEIAAVYRRGSRALMIFTLLICGFLGGSASSVLLLWLSRPLPWAAEICVALLISYAVNNATGLGTTILRARGTPQAETLYSALSAGINIAVTIVLIKPFGVTGVVAGTICGNVIGSSFFLIIFHRRTKISWWQTMGCWLWKVIFAAFSSAMLVHFSLQLFLRGSTSQPILLGGIAASGALYIIGFGSILWITKFFEDEDKALISQLFKKIPRIR
jgi:O-antigen/teichoic acid export membrane protein